MPLTIRAFRGEEIVVDEDDFESLLGKKWHVYRLHKRLYAMGDRHGKRIYIHREIMSPDRGMEVDHINGNGLDNRRANLRIVSHLLNIANSEYTNNSTGFRGVVRNHRKFSATTKVNGKSKYLGTYETAEEAHEVYRKFMLERFGEHAHSSLQDAAASAVVDRQNAKE